MKESVFATSFESLCRSDPDALAVYDADESEIWSRAQLAKRADGIEAEMAAIPGNLVAIWRIGNSKPLIASGKRHDVQ